METIPANSTTETDVLIVGAGPVGLTLALDLGQRGVRCMLIERNETAIQLPKMERCNARTMEIYRRLGVAEKIRDAGLPRDAPMDVFLAASMAGPPIAHLALPLGRSRQSRNRRAQRRPAARALSTHLAIHARAAPALLPRRAPKRDGALRLRANSLRARRRLGHGQRPHAAGGPEPRKKRYAPPTWSAATAAPAPSASSLASSSKAKATSANFARRCFTARTYTNASPWARAATTTWPKGRISRFIILQDSTRHWTLHAGAESDAEMVELFRHSLAMPFDFQTLSVNQWTQHLLCAERYGQGRAFIAGDAAHLVIPTGGLGMNTGVGDAIDLSWKLAATLAGWGGPRLLASYERERRPIGLRNVESVPGGDARPPELARRLSAKCPREHARRRSHARRNGPAF